MRHRRSESEEFPGLAETAADAPPSAEDPERP